MLVWDYCRHALQTWRSWWLTCESSDRHWIINSPHTLPLKQDSQWASAKQMLPSPLVEAEPTQKKYQRGLVYVSGPYVCVCVCVWERERKIEKAIIKSTIPVFIVCNAELLPRWYDVQTSLPGSPPGPLSPGGPTGPGGPRSPPAPGDPCLPGSPFGAAKPVNQLINYLINPLMN